MSPFWPAAYRMLTIAAAPAVRAYLAHRCRLGKEDADRLPERFGNAGMPRPAGPLVWIHAASVGETQSVLALAACILAERPGIELLLTTGTVASARLASARLPARARHQFVPVDLPSAIARFLDHWRPGLAIWVESELWPNLVIDTRRRGIPMLLVNGRVSAATLAHWRRLRGLIRPLLRSFDLCLAQDATQVARFRELGGGAIATVGDLKMAAPPLVADPAALAALRREIDERPIWLAASTHPGEEEIVVAAHAAIARRRPGLLTVVAPRHPARGPEIGALIEERGLRVARRSAGEAIDAACDIYLADTLGELGLFFRLADIAFIGGSLAGRGGHNPFEAARLGCVVLHGADMSNCAAMAAALDAAGAALPVADAASLAAAVSRLLDDPAERAARSAAGARAAAAGDAVLAAVLRRLAPYLDRLAPVGGDVPAPPARGTRAAIVADAGS